MNNFFVIILKYIVPLSEIDLYRNAHLEFLNKYYESGIFIISGAKVPRDGGVIIAKSCDRLFIENILKQDPFAINNLADYQIHEFDPSRYSNKLLPIFDNL
jgi:uncharacterized protein YciI